MIGGIAATACADAAGYLLPAIIAGRCLIIAGVGPAMKMINRSML